MEANGVKVLAIVDDADASMDLRSVLTAALPGCVFLTARNGSSGIELARSRDPDVILLDVAIPGMDGFEFCRKCNAYERVRDIPVVILTAPGDSRDSRIKALEAGAVLSRPLDEPELVAQVRAMAKIKDANRIRIVETEQAASVERTRESEKEFVKHGRAEDAPEVTERAQSELLQKLNEAQSIAMIGSWEWDLRTDLVWWSDETYRIFGVTRQGFVPSFEANGKFIHPEDFQKYQTSFERSFQTGEPLDVGLRLVANDGTLKHCHAMGKIICADSGQPLRYVGTIMDITER